MTCETRKAERNEPEHIWERDQLSGPTWLRRGLHWATHPRVTSDMRDLCTVLLLGIGLIRTIDGNLFKTPQTDYAPAQLWGVLEIIIGLLILGTRSCKWRAERRGQLAASVACGFCLALSVAVFPSSAMAAFVHLSIAYVMALEAQVNECK